MQYNLKLTANAFLVNTKPMETEECVAENERKKIFLELNEMQTLQSLWDTKHSPIRRVCSSAVYINR